MSFKLKDLINKASQDAVRALLWAQGTLHISVANPAAAAFAWQQAEARQQLGAKPQQKKTVKAQEAKIVEKEELGVIDVRFVIAILVQARKGLIEDMAKAYDKACQIAELAKAKLAKACKAMKGWSNRLLAQSLGLGAARAALVAEARMEEAERKLVSSIAA